MKPKQPPKASTQSGKLPLRKRLIFSAIALLLPLALLALVEIGLRFAGYGGYPPTFNKVGQVDDRDLILTDNPGPASYFFRSRSRSGSLHQWGLLSPKPENTFRVFLVGGSAIKGYPQPKALSVSAFLEEMLSEVWPDRTVEVINLGTTAIASFPVLDIMTQALDYEPDLIVVYSGHNEFFGAYGVASLHSAGNSPAMIALQRRLRWLALTQAVESLTTRGSGASTQTLMETMMGRTYMAPDDPLRAAAARNLEAHLSEMIKRCRQRSVPLVVCTLGVNERDLAPLGDSDLSRVPAEQRKLVEDLLVLDLSWIEENPEQAIDDLDAALGISPAHARLHWLRGRALNALDRDSEALASYDRAVDLDPMPWRATSGQNAAIIRAAQQAGGVLCDARSAFRDASPHGAIGWEMMDDHVHMSLAGQCELARAIVETLTRVDGPHRVERNAFESLASCDAIASRLGENEYDRYGVAHTMRVLFRIPFFQNTNPWGRDRFEKIADEYERSMPPEVLSEVRRWQDPMTHPGFHRPITSMVGRVKMQRGEWAEAAELLRIAAESSPAYSSWWLDNIYFEMVSRQRAQGGLTSGDIDRIRNAIKYGKVLLDKSLTTTGVAERAVGRMHQLLGEFDQSIPYLRAARERMSGTDLVGIDAALIEASLRTGDVNEAQQILQHGIDHSGEYRGMYLQLNAQVQEFLRNQRTGSD